jgi:hypothetical protein
MKLANRFDDVDKQRVWLDHQYCVKCGSNQICSLHHVTGSKMPNTDSILNSSMLCHIHHKEADGHNVSDKEYQSPLLQYTMRQVLKTNYELTKKDIEFYKSNIDLYNNSSK